MDRLWLQIVLGLVILVGSVLAPFLMTDTGFAALSGIASIGGLAVSVYTLVLVRTVRSSVKTATERLAKTVRIPQLTAMLSGGLKSLTSQLNNDQLDKAMKTALRVDADLVELSTQTNELDDAIGKARTAVSTARSRSADRRKAPLSDLRDEMVVVIRRADHLTTQMALEGHR